MNVSVSIYVYTHTHIPCFYFKRCLWSNWYLNINMQEKGKIMQLIHLNRFFRVFHGGELQEEKEVQ